MSLEIQREPAAGPVRWDPRKTLIACLLVAVTAAAYGQVAGHEFVNFDDGLHVYENDNVRTGLTLQNIVWAFGIHGPSQWHPLSWLSHQLDCTLFGLNPTGHHLVNLAFHICSVVVLFFALERMTGALWPSALVAALFAVHPLNVESVAWVSERRNVLGGFFWMLSLWTYAAYAQRGGLSRYLLVVVVFALGLTAKPMLVTLPCALLLLDYWPLRRWRIIDAGDARSVEQATQTPSEVRVRSFRFLLLEKVPLLVLSAGSSLLTIWCQQSDRVVVTLDKIPMSLRLANAVFAYATYLRKMVWPNDLGVFYPHPAIVEPNPWSALLIPAIVSGALLIAVTSYAVSTFRDRPYLVVGWLWYLGTLIPMIGVVQVGQQQMADRYSYVSLIGVFIAIAWSLDEGMAAHRHRRIKPKRVLPPLMAIVPLTVVTWVQAGYWQNSVALFEHTANVTSRNHWAHTNWGFALHEQGKLYEAAEHYRIAINFVPDYALAHYNLGVVLHDLRRFGPAEHHFRRALRSDPRLASAHVRLGALCGEGGRFDEAVTHFRRALNIDPHYALAHLNLGIVLERRDEHRGAVKSYREAVTIKPDYVKAHYRLAQSLLDLDELAEAQKHFQRVIELSPESSAAHHGLGLLSLRRGDRETAVKHFQEGLRLDPNSTEIRESLLKALGDKTNAD